MSRRYPPLEGPGEGESGAEGWVDDHIDVDDVAGGGLCVRDGSDGLAPPADRSLDGEGGVREPQVLVELHREIHRHGVVDAGALDRELRVDAEDLVQRGVRLDIDAAGGRAVTELGLVEVPGRDQLLIAEDHLAEVTTLVDDQEYTPLRPLVDWLDYNGYRLVTKPAREFTDAQGRKRWRGDMDVEIACACRSRWSAAARVMSTSPDWRQTA